MKSANKKSVSILAHKANIYLIFHRYIIHEMEPRIAIHLTEENNTPPNENPLKNVMFLLITKMDSFAFVYAFTINGKHIIRICTYAKRLFGVRQPYQTGFLARLSPFRRLSLPHSHSLFLSLLCWPENRYKITNIFN